MSAVEIAVVGGGPAGAAAALRLARAGRAVTLIEREREPGDKVCGEFLSPTALRELAVLKVDPWAEGAVALDRLAFACGGRRQAGSLPFPAASLSRKRLDAALLAKAEAAGVRLLSGTGVRALDREDEAYILRLGRGRRLLARHVFMSCGKHDLRGAPRPAGAQPGLIGFKMHFTGGPPPSPEVLLASFPGGYAGLEPVEESRLNLCLLVERHRFRALGGRWAGLLAAILARTPALARALEGWRPLWPQPLAIARLPYGYLRRESDGPWWLGDQAAVIPSFAGEGIAIALMGARAAAEAFLAGEDACSFQRSLAARLAPQVGRATLFSRLIVRPWPQKTFAAALPLAGPALRGLARATRVS